MNDFNIVYCYIYIDVMEGVVPLPESKGYTLTAPSYVP